MKLDTRITATYTADEIRDLIAKDLQEKGYDAKKEEIDFVINKAYTPIGPYEQAEVHVLNSAKVLVKKK